MMTHEEIAKILAICASVDRRQVSQTMIVTWSKALDQTLCFNEATHIVTKYYAENRHPIMPCDINAMHRDIRQRRVEAYGRIPIPDGLEDEPEVELLWRKNLILAIQDGHPAPDEVAWNAIGREPSNLGPVLSHAPRITRKPL
ncbi:hypothetical protein [Schaalia sp. lx-100]|uniref:hypothetical protein n=1 Tax=Schaalia sp. lx-100 TaxID=2899081 RepID=UPI001E3D6601|nr:hypothetical protein [Schaalia sp. lx-100]MCD4557629.1 hypothetical protein [Schaalia sp. lx-100]